MPRTFLKAALYDWESAHLLQRQQGDVDFYTRVAQGRVLELACGTGRVTQGLVAAGLDVAGLDLDEAMLQAARVRLGDGVPLHVGDMRSFDLGRRFDTVLLPYNSFTLLLTREEQEACLASVARHLVPGGLFAFEITPFLLRDEPCDWEHVATAPLEPGSGVVVAAYQRVWADKAHQRNRYDMRYEVYQGTRCTVVEDTIHTRTVFRYEMELLLERHGFRVERIDGDYAGTPLEDCADEGMVFTTRLC